MEKTVAVVGASSSRSKFGNKALRAFAAQGYRVLPINPNEPQVEGLTAYASVLAVAEPIDNVSVRRLKADALVNGADMWMPGVHAAVDHRDNDPCAGSSCERWIGDVKAPLQETAGKLKS